VGAALEYEYEIPKADALELLATCTHTVTKVRTKVPADDGLYWEVDQFSGANDGLVLAEIELPSLDTSVELPDWLGDEITGDHSYANSRLALVPKLDHHLQYPIENVLLKANT
jgi:adenylate cyclase